MSWNFPIEEKQHLGNQSRFTTFLIFLMICVAQHVFVQCEGFSLLKFPVYAFLLKAINHQQNHFLDLVDFLVCSVMMSNDKVLSTFSKYADGGKQVPDILCTVIKIVQVWRWAQKDEFWNSQKIGTTNGSRLEDTSRKYKKET